LGNPKKNRTKPEGNFFKRRNVLGTGREPPASNRKKGKYLKKKEGEGWGGKKKGKLRMRPKGPQVEKKLFAKSQSKKHKCM